MDISQNLRELLREQQVQADKVEAALKELESADYLRENGRLREQARADRDLVAELSASVAALTEENRGLRERLTEQMYAQRETLLHSAKKEADLLFRQEEQAAVNSLAAYGAGVRGRLAALRAALEEENGEEAAALLARVAEVEELGRRFMRERSARLAQGFANERARATAEEEALAQQELTPGQVAEKVRQNNLELRVGGKLTVIVGVFFILLAVVFGLRYTYLYLLKSDLVKGLLAYLLGALFMGGAELMGRRQRTVFSTGICAGGVAILFASTAVSYFNLGILSIPAAVGICVAVTALALVQALRYDSQVVAVFALIGGYLPMTAVDGSRVMIVSAMGYFLLLSLFVLLVALKKRWQALKFFSMGATALGTWYLLGLMDFATAPGIVYVAANFLLYMAIVLAYPLLRRAVLRGSDTVLMGLGTCFACGFLFYLLYRGGYDSLFGVVALGFCALYFALAKVLGALLEQDAGARGLFYATSFAFWVLMIPLQFDPELVSLGWLIEGVALWVHGILADRRWYRRAGGVISAFCLVSFLLADLLVGLLFWYEEAAFLWRYGAVTLGALAVMAAALYKEREGQPMRGTQALTCCALANLWLFGLYASHYLLREYANLLWEDYLVVCVPVLLTLGLGALYRFVAVVRSRPVLALARVLYILGLGGAFVVAAALAPGYSRLWYVVAMILLVAFCLAAVAAMLDLLRGLGASREWTALLTCLYALALLLAMVAAQAGLGMRSMALSLVMVAWAFAAVVFGFVRRYTYLRRFGLALSLVAISKLFLVDLHFLASGQRILSYFVFGVVFIAISYVYQLFSKKLFSLPAGAAEAGARSPEDEQGGGPLDPA